jgi:hypothetical protein
VNHDLNQAHIFANISPPLDSVLADLLLEEYLSLEKRFLLRDWEPATLDGGQFCEIAARCTYEVDSGQLNRKKGVNACLNYIENDSNRHAFPSRNPRKDALQLCKAIRLIYQFRSNRGAVHIDPDYSANEMDSRMVMETVRWILCELVRIFWTGDPSTAARAVQAIVMFRVPAVFRDEVVPIVQNPDLDAEDELLVLLRDQGTDGMTSGQLKRSSLRHHSTVDKAINGLGRARLITANEVGAWILTDRGRARVDRELYDSLAL